MYVCFAVVSGKFDRLQVAEFPKWGRVTQARPRPGGSETVSVAESFEIQSIGKVSLLSGNPELPTVNYPEVRRLFGIWAFSPSQRISRVFCPRAVRVVLTLCALGAQCAWSDESPADRVRDHLRHGRYDEAREFLDSQSADVLSRPELVISRYRLACATTSIADARRQLEAAVAAHPMNALLLATLAECCWQQGDLSTAAKQAAAALEIDDAQLLARLIAAKVAAERGENEAASHGFRWFIRFYNSRQPKDAESLLLVAEGAVEYARWHGIAQIYDFIVNTLCKDALADDPKCVDAHLVTARLLMEKYNRKQAQPSVQLVLAQNPRSVAAHVLLGRMAFQDLDFDTAREEVSRALEIRPVDPAALLLLADLELISQQFEACTAALDRYDEAAGQRQAGLARRAGVELSRGSLGDPEVVRELIATFPLDPAKIEQTKSPFAKYLADVSTISRRPGYFLTELAGRANDLRQYRLAEDLYRAAIEAMPGLPEPRTELALLCTQLGRLDEARQLLDKAFQADPYHVRVSNLRKVVKLLDDYAILNTPHFVVRADRESDAVLARVAADYLEEIYGELTTQFAFEPESRTVVEFYFNGRGVTGHQWFSTRMIGLPWIQTIGASNGVLVAMASPTSLDESLNWGRVLRHEFVHVLTLQKTNYQIPHWFTEALATRSEGYSRPEEWNRELIERAASNDFYTLAQMDHNFRRPKSRRDWNFAYCQSVLFADYLVKEFGDDALNRLLDSYAAGDETSAAFEKLFGKSVPEMEQSFFEMVRNVAASLVSVSEGPSISPRDIADAFRKDPESPEAAANFAWLLARQKQYRKAKPLAMSVLEAVPGQRRATFAMLECLLDEKEHEQAVRLVETLAAEDRRDYEGLIMSCRVYLAAGDYTRAEEYLHLGRSEFPGQAFWDRAGSIIAIAQDDLPAARESLSAFAAKEPDDASCRARLAELFLDDGDIGKAAEWAKQALRVDARQAAMLRIVGRHEVWKGNFASARAWYDDAIALAADQSQWRVEYAEILIALKDNAQARRQLEIVLSGEPEHAQATELLTKLPPPQKN